MKDKAFIKQKIIEFGYTLLDGKNDPNKPNDPNGLQHSPDELSEFLALCEERDVKKFLELGTSRGGLTRFLRTVMEYEVTTVDIVNIGGDLAGARFIHASTVDAYPQLYKERFDAILIDAGHTYEDVRRDHMLYRNMAPIIAFHDVEPGRRCCVGVAQYWNELKVQNLGVIDISDGIGTGWYEKELRPDCTLSIVSGTFNRIDLLKKMIASARDTLPRGISYEFIIIDGGSTDGTLKWLRSQQDVHLIEDGKLTGAISAFTRAAYEARGKYVIMANDDIQFLDGSIPRALAYMENRPLCGAVAFADNRFSKNVYRVAKMGGKHPENGAQLIYAQVGMFRRWLGNWADWWGANTAMQDALTYAGDNYLSAKVWESGLSVDAVDGVRVFDVMPNDELRKINNGYNFVEIANSGKVAPPDSAKYYEAFPTGPTIPNTPVVSANDPEKLRILYLPILSGTKKLRDRQLNQKVGLRKALGDIGIVWEVDYRNTPDFDLSAFVEAWQPHLMLMQYHGGDSITPTMMQKARAVRPSMLAINWCGDAGEARTHSKETLNVLEHFDLQMSKETSACKVYEKAGIKWAYWQQGIEEPVGDLPDMPVYDIVALMNVYNNTRRELAVMLEDLPYNVGRYGQRWPTKSDGENLYDYAEGKVLYKQAKLAVSDTFSKARGFCSNRTMQCLAAGGALLLLQKSIGLRKWTGLNKGTHYIEWENLDDLKEKIEFWMEPENEIERQKIVLAGQKFVQKNFSYNALVRQLAFEILPEVRNGVK